MKFGPPLLSTTTNLSFVYLAGFIRRRKYHQSLLILHLTCVTREITRGVEKLRKKETVVLSSTSHTPSLHCSASRGLFGTIETLGVSLAVRSIAIVHLISVGSHSHVNFVLL